MEKSMSRYNVYCHPVNIWSLSDMSKFKPGESGNPQGRPKGSKNRTTKLLESLGNDLEVLLDTTKRAALSGDMVAMRILLDRLLPPRKATVPDIEVPYLEQANTISQKVDAILHAIGRGEVPADIGSQLITALGTAARIEEITQFKDRLEGLEQAVKG